MMSFTEVLSANVAIFLHTNNQLNKLDLPGLSDYSFLAVLILRGKQALELTRFSKLQTRTKLLT